MTPITTALLAAAVAFAGPLPKTTVIQPETDKLILEGLDALYAVELDKADRIFKQADSLQPEHPAGSFFQAGSYWLRFSQDADLAGTADELEPAFNDLMETTIKRAEKLIEKDPKSADGHFFLAAAYGMRGRWQILKRQWIRAAMNGYKSFKLLKKTIEIEPEYYDAYLGLGMYNYYSDKLPAVLKLASIVVQRGDRKVGLEQIQTTIDKGHFSEVEAKIFLVGLYTGYEQAPRRALPIIGELREHRPDNPFFTFLEVVARIDMKDWIGAIAFGEILMPKLKQHPFGKEQQSLFELYLASAYIGNKDYEKALGMLDRCVDHAPDPRRASVTFCQLRRAQVYDIIGKRDAAKSDYKAVAKKPDFFDSDVKAKEGLKKPVTYDQVILQLLE